MENMIGFDLGKRFFQVHCADDQGKKPLRLRRLCPSSSRCRAWRPVPTLTTRAGSVAAST